MNGYRLLSHPAVRKDLRKLPKQTAARMINEVFPTIVGDPFGGVPLRGELRGLWKLIIHDQGVSYRVVYEPDTKARTIFVLGVGPRGEFYDRLSRRLR